MHTVSFNYQSVKIEFNRLNIFRVILTQKLNFIVVYANLTSPRTLLSPNTPKLNRLEPKKMINPSRIYVIRIDSRRQLEKDKNVKIPMGLISVKPTIIHLEMFVRTIAEPIAK